jgi:hypothetical protein
VSSIRTSCLSIHGCVCINHIRWIPSLSRGLQTMRIIQPGARYASLLFIVGANGIPASRRCNATVGRDRVDA